PGRGGPAGRGGAVRGRGPGGRRRLSRWRPPLRAAPQEAPGAARAVDRGGVAVTSGAAPGVGRGGAEAVFEAAAGVTYLTGARVPGGRPALSGA
ncbi:hypothetical protein AB0N23_23510, partial [Streptomyces sp. NPDC052644]